jgi:sigma-B regulation protein RsbU (phosphoserine phosphatase)
MLKDVHGMFLGGMDDNEYEKSEIQLRRGDRLLLYTDGVTEAINPDKKMYGIDRLSALLDQSDKDSPDEVLRKVLDDVNRFASGKPQFDDITLLMLEIGKQD